MENKVKVKIFSDWDQSQLEQFDNKLDKMMCDENGMYSEDMNDRVAMEKVPGEEKVLLTDLESGDQMVAEYTEDGKCTFTELVPPSDAPEAGSESAKIEPVGSELKVGDKCRFTVMDKECTGTILTIESNNNMTIKPDAECGLDLESVAVPPTRVKAFSKRRQYSVDTEDLMDTNSSMTTDMPAEVPNPSLTDGPATVATTTVPTTETVTLDTEKVAKTPEVPAMVASDAPQPPVAPVVTNPGTELDEIENPYEDMVIAFSEEDGEGSEEMEDEEPVDTTLIDEIEIDDMPSPAIDPMEQPEEGVRTYSKKSGVSGLGSLIESNRGRRIN